MLSFTYTFHEPRLTLDSKRVLVTNCDACQTDETFCSCFFHIVS